MSERALCPRCGGRKTIEAPCLGANLTPCYACGGSGEVTLSSPRPPAMGEPSEGVVRYRDGSVTVKGSAAFGRGTASGESFVHLPASTVERIIEADPRAAAAIRLAEAWRERMEYLAAPHDRFGDDVMRRLLLDERWAAACAEYEKTDAAYRSARALGTGAGTKQLPRWIMDDWEPKTRAEMREHLDEIASCEGLPVLSDEAVDQVWQLVSEGDGCLSRTTLAVIAVDRGQSFSSLVDATIAFLDNPGDTERLALTAIIDPIRGRRAAHAVSRVRKS